MYNSLDFIGHHVILLFVAHEDYKRSLDLAKVELGQLRDEKAKFAARLTEIDRHITAVIEGIKGLARLCDQQVTKELLSGNPTPLAGQSGKLSDAVRLALQTSSGALSPVQVRERLIALGYDTSKYTTDFLATLHTVLKRLQQHHEVEAIALAGGKTGYKWITETDKLAGLEQEVEIPKVRRSRGALGSIDSGWIPGFGEVPGHKN